MDFILVAVGTAVVAVVVAVVLGTLFRMLVKTVVYAVVIGAMVWVVYSSLSNKSQAEKVETMIVTVRAAANSVQIFVVSVLHFLQLLGSAVTESTGPAISDMAQTSYTYLRNLYDELQQRMDNKHNEASSYTARSGVYL
jgi:hypothetical protein